LPLNDDRDRECKRRAVVRLRLDPYLAAVHLDDALRYREPQARAAFLAGRSITIIAVTSYALDGEEKTARAAGCDDYASPLLTQSGHPDTLNQCPLLGVKRTLGNRIAVLSF